MRKKTILSIAAALAAIPALVLAAKKWQDLPEQEVAEPDADVTQEKMVSYPLKNKYTDYANGPDQPRYLFELETPDGAREFEVTLAHYETYYIGDEVICIEENGRLTVA